MQLLQQLNLQQRKKYSTLKARYKKNIIYEQQRNA
jgi:hypothetical protein